MPDQKDTRYVCRECLGQTRSKIMADGKARIYVEHAPKCITGKWAFQQVHHNARKGS
jgi:hypothetical protein